jgi:hypothetical protein
MSKKCLALAVACGVLQLLSQGAIADPSLARLPVAITQLYEGGDFSTLRCPFSGFASGSARCVFESQFQGSRKSFSIDPGRYGYHVILQEYRLFDAHSDDNLGLHVWVGCEEADIILAGVDEANLTCVLEYRQKGDALMLNAVSVRYITSEGRPAFLSRRLETDGETDESRTRVNEDTDKT